METFQGELRSKFTVRRRIALLAALIPVFASADDLAMAKQMMGSALGELAGQTRLTVVLSGIETDGTRKNSIYVALALDTYMVDNRPVPYLEVTEYRNNELLTRSAADGTRFWNYDLKDREYTSVDYATASFVGKEKERLYQNLMLRSKGASNLVARLMKDVYTGDINTRSNWQPWRPGATVTLDDAGNIVCDSAIPNTNKLTYVMARTQFGYTLEAMKYYEESKISDRWRTSTWDVTIHRSYLPDDVSFQFVPPKGARAIAINEARGGF